MGRGQRGVNTCLATHQTTFFSSRIPAPIRASTRNRFCLQKGITPSRGIAVPCGLEKWDSGLALRCSLSSTCSSCSHGESPSSSMLMVSYRHIVVRWSSIVCSFRIPNLETEGDISLTWRIPHSFLPCVSHSLVHIAADLTLLFQKKIPPNAFEDKVQ